MLEALGVLPLGELLLERHLLHMSCELCLEQDCPYLWLLLEELLLLYAQQARGFKLRSHELFD